MKMYFMFFKYMNVLKMFSYKLHPFFLFFYQNTNCKILHILQCTKYTTYFAINTFFKYNEFKYCPSLACVS